MLLYNGCVGPEKIVRLQEKVEQLQEKNAQLMADKTTLLETTLQV